jgi:hypothetical protein
MVASCYNGKPAVALFVPYMHDPGCVVLAFTLTTGMHHLVDKLLLGLGNMLLLKDLFIIIRLPMMIRLPNQAKASTPLAPR